MINKNVVFIRRLNPEVSGYRRFHYNGLVSIPTWISNHM